MQFLYILRSSNEVVKDIANLFHKNLFFLYFQYRNSPILSKTSAVSPNLFATIAFKFDTKRKGNILSTVKNNSMNS